MLCQARLCKLQKRCTRLACAAASDKVYQLLAHGRWFSPGTPLPAPLKVVAISGGFRGGVRGGAPYNF
jgi:hypothetical protein